MSHFLGVFTGPDLRRERLRAANLEARDGVRVEDRAALGEALWFRAAGAVSGGVYVEEEGGAARARFLDAEGGRASAPRPFSGGVALRRGARVHVAREGGAAVDVEGDTFAVASEAPVGVVLDRRGRRLLRVDLETLEVAEVARVEGALERQVRPVVSLDAAGRRVLLMDGGADGQVSLLDVDLATGRAEVVRGPLPPRSWVVGAFAPRGAGLVVLEQRFSPQVRARLLLVSGARVTTLLEVDVPQPMSRPWLLDPSTAVVAASLEPAGLASYGPVDLYSISIPGGTRARLTERGDVRGSPCARDGRLEVDTGTGLLSFTVHQRR